MNKKFIAVILAVVVILGAVMFISGCNKDDDGTTLPNESTSTTPETEQTTEEPSVEGTESTSGEKETEKQTEKETEAEPQTSKPATSQTEKPTDNDEPATCDKCGGIIVDNSDTDLPLVGKYCDGKCDEWLGELEL